MVETKGSKAVIKGAKVARKRALSAGGKKGSMTKKVAASSPGGKKKQARKRKSPSTDGPDTVSPSTPTDATPVPRRSKTTQAKNNGPPTAAIPKKTPPANKTAPVAPANPSFSSANPTTGNFARRDKDVSANHKAAFEYAIADVSKGKNCRVPTEETYHRMVDVLQRNKEGKEGGESMNKLRTHGFPSAPRWIRNHSVITSKCAATNKDDYILIKKPDNPDTPLDRCLKVCTKEKLFDVLYEEHRHNHVKGEGLWRRLRDKYSNIPRNICCLFTKTCPQCLESGSIVKKPVAGNQPILTPGFGKRGQFDIVDMQSCPDLGFKYLCNYVDHGTKFLWSQPITNQRASTVALVLVQAFTIIGPPAILQPDNARNMAQIATIHPKAKKVNLDNEYVDCVIRQANHMWPEVKMVRGTARRSTTNGGVERVNGSSVGKIGLWMVEFNTPHWSIGARICNWR